MRKKSFWERVDEFADRSFRLHANGDTNRLSYDDAIKICTAFLVEFECGIHVEEEADKDFGDACEININGEIWNFEKISSNGCGFNMESPVISNNHKVEVQFKLLLKRFWAAGMDPNASVYTSIKGKSVS